MTESTVLLVAWSFILMQPHWHLFVEYDADWCEQSTESDIS